MSYVADWVPSTHPPQVSLSGIGAPACYWLLLAAVRVSIL